MTVRGHGQHVRHGRPRRPHPRRLPPALRREPKTRQAGRRRAQAVAVDQAHRRLDEIENPTVARDAVAATRSRTRSRRAAPTRASSGEAAPRAALRLRPVGARRDGSGPDPGRYVVRRYAGDAAQQVVVFSGTRGAARAGRRARAPRPAEAEPRPSRSTRATVIDADTAHGERREALARAAAGRGDGRRGARRARPAALHAHRIATADPYRGEPAPRQPLATRVGYGTGEQVADGRWTEARELRPPRGGRARRHCARRSASPRCWPARDVALACELLALRARLDLDQRARARGRAAARRGAGRRAR